MLGPHHGRTPPPIRGRRLFRTLQEVWRLPQFWSVGASGARLSLRAAMLPPRLTSPRASCCGTDIATRYDVYTPFIVVYTPLTDVFTPLIDVYTPLNNVYPPFPSLTIEWLVPVVLSLSCDLREPPFRALQDVAPMTAPPRTARTRARAVRLSGASVLCAGPPALRLLRARRSAACGLVPPSRRRLERLGAPLSDDGEMVRAFPCHRAGRAPPAPRWRGGLGNSNSSPPSRPAVRWLSWALLL